VSQALEAARGTALSLNNTADDAIPLSLLSIAFHPSGNSAKRSGFSDLLEPLTKHLVTVFTATLGSDEGMNDSGLFDKA
jgi:hypothetical protein